VVPAFNEEGRLPATLDRIAGYLLGQAPLLPAEVIVVDDGSTDGTVRVAESFAAPADLSVRVVRFGRNRGKGAAVRAGLAASRGAWVLVSDADLATPIEELGALVASGAALAVGSRGVKRELIVRRQPLPRDTLGRLFNLGLRVLGLTSLHDKQCGFKLLEGQLARRLAGELRLDGFAFDVEFFVAEVAFHIAFSESHEYLARPQKDPLSLYGRKYLRNIGLQPVQHKFICPPARDRPSRPPGNP